MKTQYAEYDTLLRERLTPKRYKHSINVMERAVELAELYGADRDKAELAGLIHDVEKNTSLKIMLQSIENSGILLTDTERLLPQLWHGICGYLYAKDKLFIQDEDVLNAIRYHVTGRAGMSLLEKIVYVADLTSAERDYEDAKTLRKLANKDLDKTILHSQEFILGEMVKTGQPLHSDSVACYNEIAIKRCPKPEIR